MRTRRRGPEPSARGARRRSAESARPGSTRPTASRRRGCAQLDNPGFPAPPAMRGRSEEHTSELQSRVDLVCRLLLEKKKNTHNINRDRNVRTKESTVTLRYK